MTTVCIRIKELQDLLLTSRNPHHIKRIQVDLKTQQTIRRLLEQDKGT